MSSAVAPTSAATSARAASIAGAPPAPRAWVLDGLPGSSRHATVIASTTSRRARVVALWSR